MVSNPVVNNFVVFVKLQVQDQGLWSAQRDEVFAEGPHELVWIFYHFFGEAIHSEVDGCQVFDHWVVGEHADVGSRSERG